MRSLDLSTLDELFSEIKLYVTRNLEVKKEGGYKSRNFTLIGKKHEKKSSSLSSNGFTMVEDSDDVVCMASKVKINFKNKPKLSRNDLCT